MNILLRFQQEVALGGARFCSAFIVSTSYSDVDFCAFASVSFSSKLKQLQLNSCFALCLTCVEFGLWLKTPSGVHRPQVTYVRTRERRKSVNSVHAECCIRLESSLRTGLGDDLAYSSLLGILLRLHSGRRTCFRTNSVVPITSKTWWSSLAFSPGFQYNSVGAEWIQRWTFFVVRLPSFLSLRERRL